MPDIGLRFNQDVLVLEGAMGTMLQQQGVDLGGGMCVELLNVLEPDLIQDLHRRYHLAGAQCAITNSFGATRAKLDDYQLGERVEELNRAAVRNARAGGAPHILADVGPCGLVMEPLGTASFNEVYQQYFEQISALAAEQPDAILIETMVDIADARCALLAAQAACDLPVFVSCTYDANGRMELSGTDATSAAVILEACGAACIGINCGLGPEQMLPVLQELASATTLPLLIQPNAGIPYIDAHGVTVFPTGADEFADFAVQFRASGAQFIGSCCGSTPAYTGALYAAIGDMPVVKRPQAKTAGCCALASPRKTVLLGVGQPARIIGERINPTGKPELTSELEQGQLSAVRSLAEAQEDAGADLIDVNMGAAMVDEGQMLPKAVLALLGFTACPLVLDCTDPITLEKTLRAYPGRALINSVSGDEDSLAKILPLAKRYGAAVVALALDASGIPDTAEGRMAVVERIVQAAKQAGLSKNDILIDALVLTAATDKNAAATTLTVVQAATDAGLATVLGVSNISHGLPERAKLNTAFAQAALTNGLSAAIVNPSTESMLDCIARYNASAHKMSRTDAWQEWLQAYDYAIKKTESSLDSKSAHAQTAAKSAQSHAEQPLSAEEALKRTILRGDTEAVPPLIDAVVAQGQKPEHIVESLLTPVMNELGEAFAAGTAFLPQMIIAAGAMKAAVLRIKQLLPASDERLSRGTVVFCSVQGDVHSIGKDICIALLESQDFRVVDLGVDVAPDAVLQAAQREKADVVCLSALMTTTLPLMRETVELLHQEIPEYTQAQRKGVFVGGAVVSQKWADLVGAHYADDAPGCVEAIRRLVAP